MQLEVEVTAYVERGCVRPPQPQRSETTARVAETPGQLPTRSQPRAWAMSLALVGSSPALVFWRRVGIFVLKCRQIQTNTGRKA